MQVICQRCTFTEGEVGAECKWCAATYVQSSRPTWPVPSCEAPSTPTTFKPADRVKIVGDTSRTGELGTVGPKGIYGGIHGDLWVDITLDSGYKDGWIPECVEHIK